MGTKQKLNLFDFTMIVVGLVIGMGIFPPSDKSAITFIFFAAWIGGCIIAICGALTNAEIGSQLLFSEIFKLKTFRKRAVRVGACKG